MKNIKEYENMMMLDLQSVEREQLTGRLEALNRGFAALEQADTDGVEPLVTVLGLDNILRDDVAKKLYTREEILSNAPEREGGFFKAPGTLE